MVILDKRRKMINKVIRKIFGKINIEKKLGLDLTLRPSEISEEKYYQITEVYEKKFYNDN